MTAEELDILTASATRDSIMENIGRDPVAVALDKNIPHAAIVASQVKYLQKARIKIPFFYEAGCVFSRLSFEQSSSEETARHKFSDLQGDLAFDLTCGLGVDSFHLAKHFQRVVSVEREPDQARISAYNFGLLGAHNVEVVCASAEDFISEWLCKRPGEQPDLIYADPDRRPDGRQRVAALSDCTPDILTLLPDLKRLSRELMFKLSPVFDVAEVFRNFGTDVSAEAVSVRGECRELVVRMGDSVTEAVVKATVPGKGSIEYRGEMVQSSQDKECLLQTNSVSDLTGFQYVIVPDAAVAKVRLAAWFYGQYGACIVNNGSLAMFAQRDLLPEEPFGKVYRIKEVIDYDPKKIKKHLKDSGIKRLNIVRRGFPVPASQIITTLGITEGGETYAVFVSHGKRRKMMLAEAF